MVNAEPQHRERLDQILAGTEQLVAQLLSVDPTDLQGLSVIHTAFARVAEDLAALPADLIPPEKAKAHSAQGQKLIEQIVLAEVTDVSKALADAGQALAALQDLLRSPGTPDQPVTSAPEPVWETRAADLAENPITASDLPLVLEFIAEARGHLELAEAELLKLEERPDDLETVNTIFRGFHTIKGVAGFLNLRQIGACAHAAENLLDLARNGKLRIAGSTADVVLESLDLMKGMLAHLDEAARASMPIPNEPTLPALLVRLREHASGKVTESAPRTAQAAAPVDQPAGEAKPASTSAAPAEATIKVSMDRLDRLIDTVGELVIAQSMVSQDVAGGGRAADNQRLGRNMVHLGKITRELQDLTMSMRMIPINGVFQKMARIVRDLGKRFGKEIDFVVSGAETELDRNVVEAIGDPLMHMVRNAVDHGLEDPEARVAAGKSRAGRLELRAYHQAGSIVIEIVDDGRGLNKAKILKKAVAAGIVREGQELSEAETFKLIFHAGLSTAEKLTDVSGRGVGMDVVRKNVEALRGRIDIASVEGRGSTFTIRLPLTLAVIDGMIVRVGDERYIVPLTSIEQSLQPKAEQISTVQRKGEVCMVRDQLLPLFRLHRLFNVKPRHEDPTKGLVVLVQDNDRRCGLLVDDLLGQQQVVIKSLGDGIGRVPGISGGAILGDGNVSLILDIAGILELSTSVNA